MSKKTRLKAKRERRKYRQAAKPKKSRRIKKNQIGDLSVPGQVKYRSN